MKEKKFFDKEKITAKFMKIYESQKLKIEHELEQLLIQYEYLQKDLDELEAKKVYDSYCVENNPHFMRRQIVTVEDMSPEAHPPYYWKAIRKEFDSKLLKKYEDAYNKYEEISNGNSMFKGIKLALLKRKHDIFKEHLRREKEGKIESQRLDAFYKLEGKIRENKAQQKKLIGNILYPLFMKEAEKIYEDYDISPCEVSEIKLNISDSYIDNHFMSELIYNAMEHGERVQDEKSYKNSLGISEEIE